MYTDVFLSGVWKFVYLFEISLYDQSHILGVQKQTRTCLKIKLTPLIKTNAKIDIKQPYAILFVCK